MNRLFDALLCVTIMTFMVMSAFACTKGNENMTGAACSIADLNNLHGKYAVKEKAITTYREDRNLRPVKIYKKPTPIEIFDLNCHFGICMPREFLEIGN